MVFWYFNILVFRYFSFLVFCTLVHLTFCTFVHLLFRTFVQFSSILQSMVFCQSYCFTQNANMKRHLANIHQVYSDPTHIKYFQCDLCEYSSKNKQVLENHKRSVHENVKYYCPQCTAAYSWQSDLYKHIKTHM